MSSTAEAINITSKTTKADLEREVRRLAALANDNHNELESFRNRVYEVALEQKEENDWCDEGFTKAMNELGLKTPARYKRVTIVVDVDMLDGKGPIGADISDLDGYEDNDIIDSVVSALDSISSSYSAYNRETIHTLKVEDLDEVPDKTLTEANRRGSSYGLYGG